jgi:hypothetical protein
MSDLRYETCGLRALIGHAQPVRSVARILTGSDWRPAAKTARSGCGRLTEFPRTC